MIYYVETLTEFNLDSFIIIIIIVIILSLLKKAILILIHTV